jgi:hypothetical protein
MNGFLDSEEDTSMPVDGSLLNAPTAPSGEEMAQHCQFIHQTDDDQSVIALAALILLHSMIAAVSYTSRLPEHQLGDALRLSCF